MSYDLLVTDCQLVRPDTIIRCNIGVRDGRVAALLDPADVPAAARTIDAGGRHVVPGLIDTHVHLGNAGQTFATDCRTESRAAATGGVTTMLVYVVGRGSYDQLLPEYRAAVEAESLVDIMFHLAIVAPEQIPDIPRYADEYHLWSFKAFMAYKGREVSPSGIQGLTDGQMFDFFRHVARVPGGIAVVHCENIDLIEWLQRPMMATGRQDTAAWSDARPVFGEFDAIRRAISFAQEAGVRFVLPHMGIGVGSEFLREKRWGPTRLSVETCPHYLVLDKDQDIGSMGKVNPPLRDREQVAALWDRLVDGTIDIIGSDHCPYKDADKGPDLWSARPGITGGVAMILPVLLTDGVHAGRLPITRFVELTSAGPARAFGLYPRKGALEVGSDADCVILDEGAEVRVSVEALNTGSDSTPYEGYLASGWAATTIVRGQVVYDRREIVAEPGRGQLLLQNASRER